MNATSERHATLARLRAAGLSVLLALAAGCEPFDHEKGDAFPWSSAPAASSASKSGSKSSAIVGTWKLVAKDGGAWYGHFAADGSWKITDDAKGAAHRVHGTYKFDGKKFSGSMVNPNVGTGKIEGTVDGKSMTMDFVEYWHSPAKHVPYTGTKL